MINKMLEWHRERLLGLSKEITRLHRTLEGGIEKIANDIEVCSSLLGDLEDSPEGANVESVPVARRIIEIIQHFGRISTLDLCDVLSEDGVPMSSRMAYLLVRRVLRKNGISTKGRGKKRVYYYGEEDGKDDCGDKGQGVPACASGAESRIGQRACEEDVEATREEDCG